jgi:uncharacterized protein YndB with AHSA1/START domain
MVMATPETPVSTFTIVKTESIKASVEIVFESILEQMGPECVRMDGQPFPMKFEAWPGGRWFRDLGNNTGHFWGHVQVIKPPTLLEICGPMFMSYAATSHLQYRIVAEGDATKLTLTHQAIGLILPEHREGVQKGWGEELQVIRKRAESKLR